MLELNREIKVMKVMAYFYGSLILVAPIARMIQGDTLSGAVPPVAIMFAMFVAHCTKLRMLINERNKQTNG